MDNIQFQMTARKQPIQFNLSMLDETLKLSKGEAEMSPLDMKLAILNLKWIVEHQQALIEMLASELSF